MMFALWCVVVGGVLVLMALAGSIMRRLPLSAAMVYLAVGYAISPVGIGLLRVDPVVDAKWIEHLTEVAVIVSLFVAGLKLRVPLSDRLWVSPVLLATVSMVVTVALLACMGVGLGLPLGAAVLLGAVLAPTDPVLASDVQVNQVGDRDKLRFSLTAEAGLNDGTAFPFVMLGLGLLGAHELGAGWWRWWAIDVVWAITGGLGVGLALGTVVARLVLYLRKVHQEAVGLDNFLALGLIAISYGSGVLLGTWGFLAAFAAGVALRREEMRHAGPAPLPAGSQLMTDQSSLHPDHAPAVMAEAVLSFNEQIEKVLEVAAVMLLGALLAATRFTWQAVVLAGILFFIIRPISVLLVLAPMQAPAVRVALAGWFGVRGIGSVYYLAFALTQGLNDSISTTLADLAIWTVAFSIVLHGISVTPIMNAYTRWIRNRRGASPIDNEPK